MSKRRPQISIPIDDKLRQYLELAAKREDRTLANLVRRMISEAARNSETPRERAA
jgi:DNA-directed RNA polymerase subunit L